MVKRILTALDFSDRFSPQRVHISREREYRCGGTGSMWFPRNYLPKYRAEGAKQLRAASRCNCDFCDFDPHSARGQRSRITYPNGLSRPSLYH